MKRKLCESVNESKPIEPSLLKANADLPIRDFVVPIRIRIASLDSVDAEPARHPDPKRLHFGFADCYYFPIPMKSPGLGVSKSSQGLSMSRALTNLCQITIDQMICHVFILILFSKFSWITLFYEHLGMRAILISP